MVSALLKEIDCHNSASFSGMKVASSEKIATLYFGGGTPSVIPPEEIQELIDRVKASYHLDPQAEITLEANPDDIKELNLIKWKKAGVNRLSIGIQSFLDRDLRWMNRSHTAGQAEEALRLALSEGFENLSADLIFGIPHLSDQEWRENIHKLVRLQIPHISCYGLTVEPKTALAKMIQLKKKEDVDNEVQARQFLILMTEMKKAGYEHYEISNFALPGFRSRHNSSYWKEEKYLGIGPSAHSYDGLHRYWNLANNPLYVKQLNEGTQFYEMETLSEEQRFNEYILTSIRTIEGLDQEYVKQNFSMEKYDNLLLRIEQLNKDWYFQKNSFISLTDAGKLLADKITVVLFA